MLKKRKLFWNATLCFLLIILLIKGTCFSSESSIEGKKLSLKLIEELIKEKMPDKTIAGEIRKRGLSFVPTKDIVNHLKQLGAGTATIQAINAFRPWLEEAKLRIPLIISEIYQALNEGNPSRIRHMVSTDLFSNSEKLDAICFPYRYRAHYIERIIERGPDRFLADVRVLFKPIEEHAYILFFRLINDDFILEDFDDLFEAETMEGRISRELLIKMAEDVAKKFFYAAKAGNEKVLSELVSPGVELDLLSKAELQKEIANTGNTIPAEFSWISSDLISDNGLKIEVSYQSRPPGWLSYPLFWRFIIDCIDGKYLIVYWEIEVMMGSKWSAYDPNIESYTLKRFGLQK